MDCWQNTEPLSLMNDKLNMVIYTETTYCGFNYWLTHKSNKKWRWSKKEMLLKNIFSLKVTVFDSRNSSSHVLFLRDVLIYIYFRRALNHPFFHVQCIRQIFSISGVLLFQRSGYSDRFWVGPPVFQEVISSFYIGYCVPLNKHLQSFLLSKELINLPHELQPSIPWKTLILL